MNKYNRSVNKLSALIKEVFGVYDISIDTKVIVLFLAGTLPNKKFACWLDSIDALNPLNHAYKQISAIRQQGGTVFRDFIILSALQALEQDVSSDELEQFIYSAKETEHNLTDTAIDFGMLDTSRDFYDAALVTIARKQLANSAKDYKFLNNNVVLEAYLLCRSKADNNKAYIAVLHAIIEIFLIAHIEASTAANMAKKIMHDALMPFMINNVPKEVFYTYCKRF